LHGRDDHGIRDFGILFSVESRAITQSAPVVEHNRRMAGASIVCACGSDSVPVFASLRNCPGLAP